VASGGASALGCAMALGGTSVPGGQSKVLTVNAMIARKTIGGTSVPGGQSIGGGASASGDTSIVEGIPPYGKHRRTGAVLPSQQT